jgi:hypothetical protein
MILELVKVVKLWLASTAMIGHSFFLDALRLAFEQLLFTHSSQWPEAAIQEEDSSKLLLLCQRLLHF